MPIFGLWGVLDLAVLIRCEFLGLETFDISDRIDVWGETSRDLDQLQSCPLRDCPETASIYLFWSLWGAWSGRGRGMF